MPPFTFPRHLTPTPCARLSASCSAFRWSWPPVTRPVAARSPRRCPGRCVRSPPLVSPAGGRRAAEQPARGGPARVVAADPAVARVHARLRRCDSERSSAPAGSGRAGCIPPRSCAASASEPVVLGGPVHDRRGARCAARTPSSGVRLADPLASQLRTMIALQESARVGARARSSCASSRAPRPAHGRSPSLRVALVDARLTEIRWIGDVRSDPASTFSRATPHEPRRTYR